MSDAGSPSAAIPFRIEGWFGRHIGTRLVGFVMTKVLTTSTPMGRKARPEMLSKPAPPVRIRPKELASVGVERVDRIAGVVDGAQVTESGRSLDVASVIWCTGFRPGFTWVDVPVFEEDGTPRHERGVVEESPGLFFVGLVFLHAVWSETLVGVAADARYVVDHVAARRSTILGV